MNKLVSLSTSIFTVLLSVGMHECNAQQTLLMPTAYSQPILIKPQGQELKLYSTSAALIVSESAYLGGASGWPKLPNTSAEMDLVSNELVKHGFEVTRVYNPGNRQLQQEMNDFLGKYGNLPNARILFFFSGHGYTNAVNQMSYVVPADAGNPDTDYAGFISRAVPLEAFHTWVRAFKANHFLAVFDTCFSGAIFTTRGGQDKPDNRPTASEERWRYLAANSVKPVRQFISAGGPGEKLPAISAFVPVFLEALRGGASTVRDGFVTGKEIGLFVERVVNKQRAGMQNPISGVSPDTRFIFGDIIFQYGSPEFTQRSQPEPTVSLSPTPAQTRSVSVSPAPSPTRSLGSEGTRISVQPPTEKASNECEIFDCSKR